MVKKISDKRNQVILLLVLFLGLGCTTTKSVVQKIRPDKQYLKKKVMVLSPIDHSGFPSEMGSQITSKWVEMLKDTPRLLVYPSPEDAASPSKFKELKFGVVHYDPGIAAKAREMNMNAVISVYLPPIEKRKAKTGIWPFRHEKDIYEVSMVTNVLNVSNMCLYLTEYTKEEVSLDPEKTKTLSRQDALARVWDMVFPDILEYHASAVIDSLSHKPWTGRILDVADDQVTINGGKDVGVGMDQVFTVYAPGDTVMCMTGQTIDLLGEKVGEIRAVSVAQDHTLAAPLTKGPFDVGQTVMFIPN